MIQNSRRVALWVFALAAGLGACDSTSSPLVCTAEFVYGVQITAVDSATNQALTEGVSGSLVDGTFTEAMILAGNILLGAGEREGTYTATVEASGYATWNRSDIVVTADPCHVIPVELEAQLQAL